MVSILVVLPSENDIISLINSTRNDILKFHNIIPSNFQQQLKLGSIDKLLRETIMINESKITFDINNNVVITDVTTNDEILNIENPTVIIHSVVDNFNYKKRKRFTIGNNKKPFFNLTQKYQDQKLKTFKDEIIPKLRKVVIEKLNEYGNTESDT